MISERKIRKHYDRMRAVYGPLGLAVAGDVAALRHISKLEATLHRHAELACNEPLSKTQIAHHERTERNALHELRRMLPFVSKYIRVNSDPRGYALKIDPYLDDPNGMHCNESLKRLMDDSRIATDWGGYGILDPEAQIRD